MTTPPADFDLEALLEEQRRLWQDGTPTPVEAIVAGHPPVRNCKEALLDLINHEIVLRNEFSTPATCAEYLGRFPELAADLELLFEVHQAIEGTNPDEMATVSHPQMPVQQDGDWPAVPSYEVLAVLGEGGMGIVYKAHDRRLKRTVALKMIRGSRAGEEARRRFQSEAEAVAKLDHPGIVHIFDIGEYDQQPFFALEYVDGGSLSSHLKGAPQAPEPASRLVETLARSVHHAHGLGIIHRDLKPGNILLHKVGESASQAGAGACWVHDGVGYQPKIADFGLAKHVENNSDATQTQAIVGTPSYMAPEQAGDFTRRIGPSADVYALGAILYELLTGRPPFRGESVMDTLDQVRTQDPIAPTRLQPKVPRDLETICLKCLRKEPAKRYGSAEALADDLTRFLRHEPIQARPSGMLEHVRLWCQRRPLVAGLIALLISVAATGLGVGVYLLIWALAERTVALSKTAQTNAQLYDYEVKAAQDYWRDNQIDQLRSVLDSLRGTPEKATLCDFEWRYLSSLLHQDLARKPANSCVAYSRDGILLAAGVGHDIHVWKAADLEKPDPQPIAKLHGHSAELVNVAFSPKGDRLLSAAADRTVRLWDVAGQKAIETFPLGPADVTAMDWQSTDGTIATAYKDGKIHLREPDGSVRLELSGHAGTVNDLAFSADGKRLVSGSDDRSVIVWDVATGDVIHRLQGHAQNSVAGVAIHQNLIASAGLDRSVRLWDAAKGKLLHQFPRLPHKIQRLAFDPDGMRIAAACWDKTIQIWDTMPASEVYADEPTVSIRGGTGVVVGLAFAPAGHRLAAVTRDRDSTLRLWNPNREQESRAHELPKPGASMALSQTRPMVAVVLNDSKDVHLWNWKTGEHKALSGHAAPISAVAFSGDGILASASEDGKMRLWNIDEDKMLRELPGNSRPIVALEFHPRGHRLVAAEKDGTVQFWDAANGAKLHEGPRHQKAILDLAFSSDGAYLASAGSDGVIFLCDPETGKELVRFQDPGRTPCALAFSGDGQHLAAGDTEFTIRVWNLQTRQQRYLLVGHKGAVQAIAFSRSRRRLVSGSNDGTVMIWDVTTGLPLLTLRGHDREVSAVAFAADDAAVLSLEWTPRHPGHLRVWETMAGIRP